MLRRLALAASFAAALWAPSDYAMGPGVTAGLVKLLGAKPEAAAALRRAQVRTDKQLASKLAFFAYILTDAVGELCCLSPNCPR